MCFRNIARRSLPRPTLPKMPTFRREHKKAEPKGKAKAKSRCQSQRCCVCVRFLQVSSVKMRGFNLTWLRLLLLQFPLPWRCFP
eukprot:symbB.v1.2.013432.t2/scaffold931.1/size151118/4